MWSEYIAELDAVVLEELIESFELCLTRHRPRKTNVGALSKTADDDAESFVETTIA
jgi:hypothetical protein